MHISFLTDDQTKIVRVELIRAEGEPGSLSIASGWSVNGVSVKAWPSMDEVTLSKAEQAAIDEEIDARLAQGV